VGKHAKPELELEPRRDAQSCLHSGIQIKHFDCITTSFVTLYCSCVLSARESLLYRSDFYYPTLSITPN
jgi:hypothetical protein